MKSYHINNRPMIEEEVYKYFGITSNERDEIIKEMRKNAVEIVNETYDKKL